MKQFKKTALMIIFGEILLILAGNFFFLFRSHESGTSGIYRIEAERIVRSLEAEEALRENPEEMDLSEYTAVKRVSIFDAEEICNREYLVERVDGRYFRIEYETDTKFRGLWIMNLGFLCMLLVSAGVLVYLYRTLIIPFHRMSAMAYEIAKGNLSKPLKEEKSRYFGRFVWSLDMLRENLEEARRRELMYQKEKKTLILSLSHDIKTPLSAMELYAKALLEDVYTTQEEKKEAVLGISAKIKEIKGYVDEIHEISRDEILEPNVNMGECYLSGVVEEIDGYYREKLGVLHTQFRIGQYTDCLLLGDQDRLIESLQNLMENGIKYGDGRWIALQFSEEEDFMLIAVENSGCTLDEKELPNLFDSFYRGSNAGSTKGSGLGLYIVKKLMQKMDGEVFAKIEDGNFRVTLVVRRA